MIYTSRNDKVPVTSFYVCIIRRHFHAIELYATPISIDMLLYYIHTMSIVCYNGGSARLGATGGQLLLTLEASTM